MKQNIPLRRDGALIRKAKILAAQHGTSLSSLLTRYLWLVAAPSSEH
jgi:hypothetical protein